MTMIATRKDRTLVVDGTPYVKNAVIKLMLKQNQAEDKHQIINVVLLNKYRRQSANKSEQPGIVIVEG